ncbi:Solute carrier family 13 member 5 [Armadillidium nasatum]|uniref:Solute carrier family 13 member 5 n=1 Tax=Armadillidium nasatum TaxID=96803 RepID=A0A5N5T3G2_9CRUS|nr:Solute carrier family 13 member 5 [Armadillidium nasatum]KAB7501833.1 Solute carrier family 13 member 5 [Armadillidium nasatum]
MNINFLLVGTVDDSQLIIQDCHKLEENTGPVEGCLTWDVFHHKVPWGVIILIGGGFAMAEASKKSGLSHWLGSQFGILANMKKEVMLLIICSFTALLTEIMSNTAASSLLIPVLNDMSISIGVNPLYFLLPVTICTSYAFMLPVATPPNAIVFEAAKTMPVSRMMMTGLVMNILTVASAYLMINTLGYAIFDLNTFPDWANSTSIT